MSDAEFLPAVVFEREAAGAPTYDDADDVGGDVREEAFLGFGRSKKLAEVKLDPQELQKSLDDITAKLARVLENQAAKEPAGFRLESFSVGLALSASGKLLMIAEAGVEASVQLTFSRQG